MAVSKITSPITQLELIAKTNEIIDNLGGDTSEIFVAEYDTTTFSEVLDAYNAGKTLLCYYPQGKRYLANYNVESSTSQGIYGFTFYICAGTGVLRVWVSNYNGTTWNTFSVYMADNELANVLSISPASAVAVALDGKADTTLSNVSSIDSNSAVQTALDGKVSKTGDTMTGNLNISKTNPQVYLINTDMELGVTPSENHASNLRFTDKNETNLGSCYFRQQTTGVTDINLNCINPSGGSAATLRVGFDTNGEAYSSFPDTKRCDGQWIAESQTICSGRTAETSDKNWTLNLPNDSYDYEVLLVGAVTTGATSGNQARIYLQSSIIQTNVCICNAQTRTSSTVTTYGACIIPVGSNHTVTVAGWSSNTGAYSLYLRGYRRIGTNS